MYLLLWNDKHYRLENASQMHAWKCIDEIQQLHRSIISLLCAKMSCQGNTLLLLSMEIKAWLGCGKQRISWKMLENSLKFIWTNFSQHDIPFPFFMRVLSELRLGNTAIFWSFNWAAQWWHLKEPESCIYAVFNFICLSMRPTFDIWSFMYQKLT